MYYYPLLDIYISLDCPVVLQVRYVTVVLQVHEKALVCCVVSYLFFYRYVIVPVILLPEVLQVRQGIVHCPLSAFSNKKALRSLVA